MKIQSETRTSATRDKFNSLWKVKLCCCAHIYDTIKLCSAGNSTVQSPAFAATTVSANQQKKNPKNKRPSCTWLFRTTACMQDNKGQT